MCIAAGRGSFGLIGHTQPRLIAARALANRLAQELQTSVGGGVGYQVRFKDHTGPDCRVKLMTDGILLNELKHDRLLRTDVLGLVERGDVPAVAEGRIEGAEREQRPCVEGFDVHHGIPRCAAHNRVSETRDADRRNDVSAPARVPVAGAGPMSACS